MDIVRIRDIVEESNRSLTEKQWRCHEIAVRCAEFLRKENFEVVVRHGAAIYSIPFLADKIAETGREFGQTIAMLLRSTSESTESMRWYIVSHSWCEIGDVIIDHLPNINLGDFRCSGPLIIHKKGEFSDSEVRYISCSFEFSLGKVMFIVVPNFSRWHWIIPFRLVKLAF